MNRSTDSKPSAIPGSAAALQEIKRREAMKRGYEVRVPIDPSQPALDGFCNRVISCRRDATQLGRPFIAHELSEAKINFGKEKGL